MGRPLTEAAADQSRMPAEAVGVLTLREGDNRVQTLATGWIDGGKEDNGGVEQQIRYYFFVSGHNRFCFRLSEVKMSVIHAGRKEKKIKGEKFKWACEFISVRLTPG